MRMLYVTKTQLYMANVKPNRLNQKNVEIELLLGCPKKLANG